MSQQFGTPQTGSGVGTGGGSSLSAAEVKTLYENNLNTNAFTNADKVKLDSLSIATDTQSFLTALRGAQPQ